MFDHLDSSSDVPDDVALQAVHARGRQLVLRRRILQGTTTALVALAVVGASELAFGGQGRPDSLVVVSPTETPTEAPSPTETPAPSVASTATPSASPTPTATTRTTPSPSPRCTSSFPGSCPDGKPGWSTGFDYCTVPTSASTDAGRPPVAGMTLELVMPATTTVGRDLSASLVIHNDSGYDVSMAVGVGGDTSSGTADVFGAGGGGAIHGTDTVGRQVITIAAGHTFTAPIAVPTHTCADTGGQPEPALRAGSYEVGASIYYENVRITDPNASASPTPSHSPTPPVIWTVVKPLTIQA